MAFWTAAAAPPATGRSSCGAHKPSSPALPLSYLMHTGPGALTQHASLVRLRVDVPDAQAGLAAAAAGAADSDDEEGAAAEQWTATAAAVGRLHQVVVGIEQASHDACTLAVLEVLPDKSLQLLCSKTVVAKVYKSLLPHQAALGYSMAPAKACLSQKPVGAWDLQAALQAAVVKTLTGSSSGVPASNAITAPPMGSAAAAAGPAAAAGDQQQQQQHGRAWTCLSRSKLVGCDLLAAPPGQVITADFADVEAKADAGSQGLLLLVGAAGSLKFRLFSPSQTLSQDTAAGRGTSAPAATQALAACDDAALLADAGLLAAAARKLDGRPVKLLPDERLCFIKGLSAAPTDAAERQRIARLWLGSYGLLVPDTCPFLVGVAGHAEAEEAEMQVPSCCVLTNLGLSLLPGSQSPSSAPFAAAVRRLLADLQAKAVACGFWGNCLRVEVRPGDAPGTGLAEGNLQVGGTQQQHNGQSQHPAAAAAEAAASQQLKAFSLSTQWTSAADVLALQDQARAEAAGAASSEGTEAQPLGQHVTPAGAQLRGLVDASGLLAAEAGEPGGRRHQQLHQGTHAPGGGGSGDGGSKERWQGLQAYLTERQEQQQAAAAAVAVGAARGALGLSNASSLATPGPGPGSAGTSVAAAAARQAPAPGPPAGPPAVPHFAGRRAGSGKPPPAPAAKAGGAGRRPAGLMAAAAAAAAAALGPGSAGAAAVGGVAAAPKAPALGKRPAGRAAAADPAAGKAPAAKKTKAAAGAAKPKGPKKPAAPTAADAAAGASDAGPLPGGQEAAAAGAAAAAPGSEPAAAPGAAAPAQQQQQQRKRTKASDLDVAVVGAKVQAAFAASGGAALKGVSVPEMQCYLKAHGAKGGSAKRAEVEARLLGLLAAARGAAAAAEQAAP